MRFKKVEKELLCTSLLKSDVGTQMHFKVYNYFIIIIYFCILLLL